MSTDKTRPPTDKSLDPTIYQQNTEFWDKAWRPVKTPYTQMPDLPYLSSIPEQLLKYQVKSVLDLGCGSGWLSIYLSRLGFSVTGIDIAEQAINLAKTWSQSEGLKGEFIVGDITSMNFPKASFDAVVANSIFEHLTYNLAETTLEELRRLLKPNGIFFGCFDKVGTGPGQYYELADHTHVYTDKGRQGMLLRCFSDDELKTLFNKWTLLSITTIDSGSRIVWAQNKNS